MGRKSISSPGEVWSECKGVSSSSGAAYVCMCICVHMHVSVCVHTHICACVCVQGWKLPAGGGLLQSEATSSGAERRPHPPAGSTWGPSLAQGGREVCSGLRQPAPAPVAETERRFLPLEGGTGPHAFNLCCHPLVKLFQFTFLQQTPGLAWPPGFFFFFFCDQNIFIP